MDCDITAAKIIHFVSPRGTTDHDKSYLNRQFIWELLKTNFESVDRLLVAQFERHPSFHHLRVAMTDLLAIYLKKDPVLRDQLEQYLNNYYDIEALERKGNRMSDLIHRVRIINYTHIARPWHKVRRLLPI